MLKPTDLDLQRQGIRPGHWGQWLAIGVVGLVGFVVLGERLGARAVVAIALVVIASAGAARGAVTGLAPRDV